MNADVYSLTGKQSSTLELPESVFNRPAAPALLAQAVRVYLSNQRQGTKGVKTRGTVNYSTRKLWKQKGTGRARHGSRKAPIFVGGGVSHGPTGEENYHLKLTKNMRRLALFGALTQKAQQNTIKFVEELGKADAKTNVLAKLLSAVSSYPKSRILVVLDQVYPSLIKATKNLPGVVVSQVKRINTYEVLNHPVVVMSAESLDYLVALAAPLTPVAKPAPKTTAKTTPKLKVAASKS